MVLLVAPLMAACGSSRGETLAVALSHENLATTLFEKSTDTRPLQVLPGSSGAVGTPATVTRSLSASRDELADAILEISNIASADGWDMTVKDQDSVPRIYGTKTVDGSTAELSAAPIPDSNGQYAGSIELQLAARW